MSFLSRITRRGALKAGLASAAATTERLEAVMQERFPDAVVVPAVSSGFTDSHFLRDLGIAAYGYTRLLVPVQDEAGVHGNNGRISIENVRRGTEIMRQVVERVALDGG